MIRLYLFVGLLSITIAALSCAAHSTAGDSRTSTPPPADSAEVEKVEVVTVDDSVPTPVPDTTVSEIDTAAAEVIEKITAQDTSPPKADSIVVSEEPVEKQDSLVLADSCVPGPTDPIFPPDFPDSLGSNPLALRYNAIYLSSGAITRDDLMEKYIERAKQYGLGGFVMDMKDDRGYLSWRSQHPVALKIGAGRNRLSDPAAFVQRLHDNGLVACARVVVFKDPLLSSYIEDGAYPYAVLDSSTGFPWKQHNGETWANMKDERVHEYLTGIISELVEFGFDQIQLDYIRFPSDGPTELCFYPVSIDSLNKAEVIGLFLSKVRKIADPDSVSVAADVFGWVPWLKQERNYWIGQDYDVIANWTDVICPMLYSSHFPEEFKEEYGPLRAYHIVREGTEKAVERRGSRGTGVQPYIQSFNYRSPHYGPDYIIQQMQAAIAGGAVGWIAWNARSDYSMLWRALDSFHASGMPESDSK